MTFSASLTQENLWSVAKSLQDHSARALFTFYLSSTVNAAQGRPQEFVYPNFTLTRFHCPYRFYRVPASRVYAHLRCRGRLGMKGS